MCNDTLQNQIQQIIVDFMDKKVEFTAWDVTKELRKRDSDVRHCEVKNFVHRFMNRFVLNNEYKKEIRDYGSSTFAITYCHPLQSQGVDTVTAIVSGKGGLKTDSRGRYCVRAEFVKQLDTNRNNIVDVLISPGCITIRPFDVSANGDDKNLRAYIVDKDYNIRLSQYVLAHAHPLTGVVSVSNNCITIT